MLIKEQLLKLFTYSSNITNSKLKKNQDVGCIIHVLVSQHETCIFDLDKSVYRVKFLTKISALE